MSRPSRNICIGPLTFDHADYDADGDVPSLPLRGPRGQTRAQRGDGSSDRADPSPRRALLWRSFSKNGLAVVVVRGDQALWRPLVPCLPDKFSGTVAVEMIKSNL